MSSLREELVLAPVGVDPREIGQIGTRLKTIWRDVKAPLAVFLFFRIFLSVAVFLISPRLPISSFGVPWQALPGQPLLDSWIRWDSGWYANIALYGYRFATDQPSNVAFLPLYPLAIKALDVITADVWVSGIIVSNISFLGVLIVLFKLTQLKFGRAAARRTILYTSVFPAAFFFYAMYSESIYLLTVLLAFYLWERGKGWPASAFGGMAALARPMGILLFLAGAARSLVEDRRSNRPLLCWNNVPLLCIPLALGAFLAFSYVVFGDPLAFLESRAVGWNEPVSLIPVSHRQVVAAIMDGTLLTGGVQRLRLMDLASGVVFLALMIPIFRKLGSSYGLYSLGSVMMPLVVTLDGLTRYVAVIFPAFMVLGLWTPKKPVLLALCGLSAVTMALMASMFARWYFVG